MAVSKAFEAFVAELFEGLGEVRTKRMFGALALYKDDLIFALADDEAVWIKADAANEAAFLAQGSPLLTYPNKDGSAGVLPYRRLPEAALDDPEEAVRWARLGIEASHRKAAAKARPKRQAKPGAAG